MSDYNRVILVGRLASDPERRTASSGLSIATFTIATNRKSLSSEETCFAPVTAFGKQADLIADRFKKGSPILVEGRLRTDQWATPQGEKRSRLVMILESFSFIGAKDGGDLSAESPGGGKSSKGSKGKLPGLGENDEIPF